MSDKKRAVADMVYKYSVAHYEEGFDFVVECYSIADIVKEMDAFNLSTYAAAIAHYAEIANFRNDQKENARIEREMAAPDIPAEDTSAPAGNPYGTYEEQCRLHELGLINMDHDI